MKPSRTLGSRQWGERLWANAVSGWALVALRLVTGLIGFRVVWGHLNGAELGFWYLLWSLAGVGVMIDLGMGVTAMRAAVRHGSDHDDTALNRVVATCFWSIALLGAVLTISAAVAYHAILASLHVLESDTIRRSWFIFLCGLTLVFPLPVLPEVLRGYHRMALINTVAGVQSIAQVIFLVAACHHRAPLDILMAGSMIIMLAGGLAHLVITFRVVPGLSLSPAYWSWATIRDQLNFSVSAYVMGIARVAMDAAPAVLVGRIIGIPSVALLQAACKPAQLLTQFGRQVEASVQAGVGQLAENGSPGTGAHIGLRAGLVVIALVTPGIATAVVFPHLVVTALTGNAEVAHQTKNLVWLALTGALFALISELWRLTLIMIERPMLVAAQAMVQLSLTVALMWIGIAGWGLGGGLAGLVLATAPCCIAQGFTLFRITRRDPPSPTPSPWTNVIMIVLPSSALAVLLGWLAPLPIMTPILDVLWRFFIVAIPLALRWRWIAGYLAR